MHQNAIERMGNIIRQALEQCYVKDNWPQYLSYKEKIGALSKEILKTKKNWLNDIDIYIIFSDQVAEFLNDKFSDSKRTGNLIDLLAKEELEKLENLINFFYQSIPREYEVRILLPSVTDIEPGVIKIYEDVKIEVYFKRNDPFKSHFESISTLLSSAILSEKRAYLSIKQKGFIGSVLSNVSTGQALTNIKLLLNMGIHNAVFELNTIPSGQLFHKAIHEITKINLISIDLADCKRKIINTELTLAMTRFIQKIGIKRGGAATVSSENIIQCLQKSAQLIREEGGFSETIKAAASWAVDAKAEENKTFSFIQSCIGLESILGEGLGSGSLTSHLSDRCSYLIGGHFEEREKIRNSFKEIYITRSKIVHGNAPILSSEEEMHRIKASVMLDMAIAKELDMFKFIA